MALEIRPLSKIDRAPWRPLWHAYLKFYGTSISDDVAAETWRRLLDPEEQMAGALAWQGDRAVGLVHHIRHRSCWTVGDYCYLQDLFVVDDVRGRGVGRSLIEYVYAAARDDGCSRVYWLTHESNHTAMHLYDAVAEKSGMVQYRHVL